MTPEQERAVAEMRELRESRELSERLSRKDVRLIRNSLGFQLWKLKQECRKLGWALAESLRLYKLADWLERRLTE